MTTPLNRVSLFPGQAAPGVAVPQVSTTVDGLPPWRVRLETLESEMGRAPSAVFSVGLGRSALFGQDLRLEQAAPCVAPGQLVSARLLRGGTLPGAAPRDLVLFEGRVAQIALQMDGDGERLELRADDLAAEVLGRRVGGQRLLTASGAATQAAGVDLVFNPDGRPNAAPQLYSPEEGGSYAVFAPTSPAGAVPWTLAEAVAHLLAEFGQSSTLAVPTRAETLGLLGTAPIRDIDLEGRTFGDALALLLDLVGGSFIVTAEPGPSGVSRRLELWLPGKAQALWLSHQAVGETYRPAGTQVQGLAFAAHFESAPRHYVARGDRKIYESTFDLVAGWLSSLASYQPEDSSPSTNPSFDAVRDVFRKWVLNEAGEYSDSPYSRGDAPDLSALFEGAPTVRRHRRLLPCLSYDALGRSYGVYPEISLDSGSSWECLSLSAKVLEDECGLYLTEDTLPPRYLWAAMRGQVRVRVTAAIESDACLTAERAAVGAANLPGAVCRLEAPAGYGCRKVAATSRFYGQGGADEVDDTVRLQALVDAAFDADRRCPCTGRIEIPYLTLAPRVGRRVRGLRGRPLNLGQAWPGYETDPVVRRVRLRLAPTPATELELE